MELPSPLSAEVVGSFAYYTVKDRLPVILTSVIDFLCREKLNIVDEYGETASDEVKVVISSLSQLKNEMQTNKPLKLLPLLDPQPKHDDTAQWNEFLSVPQREGRQPPRWFTSPWLMVECYLYKSIHHAFLSTSTLRTLDPFYKQKATSLQQSRPAVAALEEFILRLLGEVGPLTPPHLLQAAVTALLQLCVWGNQCDLSFTGGAPAAGVLASDNGGVPAASGASSGLSVLAQTALLFGTTDAVASDRTDIDNPRIDTASPRADTASPRAVTASPRADTASPRADTASPRADTASPRADTASPRADTASPRADTASPRADTASPRADTASPRACQAENAPTDRENRPGSPTSASPTENPASSDSPAKLLQWLLSARPNLLVNDCTSACEMLRPAASGTTRSIALILDNAGYELLTDVCLSLLLLRAGVVQAVDAYVKTRPWFVSDTTAADIDFTLDWLTREGFTGLAEAWRSAMSAQQWRVKEDAYWTTHESFRAMKASRPDLYNELSQTMLVVFKGDLNYRKLVGDLNWPPTTPLPTALGEDLARLGPMLALRTVKGGPAVGASPARLQQIIERLGDPEWASKGGCGMVQLWVP